MKKYSKIAALVLVAVLAAAGLSACSNKSDFVLPEDTNPSYTYRTALSVFPTNWSMHTYKTETATTIMEYTVNGFYEFDYNEARDGYRLIPVLAESEPVDVTAQYAQTGKWGIPQGQTGRAYKIKLRDNLKWDDGTAITAQSFIESAKRLLDPRAQNYRADSLYASSLVVHGAQDYLYQGQTRPVSVSENILRRGYETLESYLADYGDSKAFINWKYSFGAVWNGTAWTQDGLQNKVVDSGMTLAQLKTFFETKGAEKLGVTPQVALSYYQDEASGEYTFGPFAFTDVGVQTDDEGNLVLILDKKLTGFTLLYALTSSWLVHEKTYDDCIKISGDGVYTNSYGTSADTYRSYGPYKLTYYKANSEFRFARNEHWFGYSDPVLSKLYQTSAISIKYVEQESTRLQMFLNGQLDLYGLSPNDMGTYGNSAYKYITSTGSTFYMALNPNLAALEAEQAKKPGTNKTILTVDAFRKALSFSLDRTAFAAATSPTNAPAYAMFGNLIIYAPEQGLPYRSTEQAKDAMLQFWDLADQVGDGKPYETKDDAIASITGYDLAGARKLFDEAYDTAVASGLLKPTDTVEIKIGTPSASSSVYNKGYEFLRNNFTQAVKGTKLEGKLQFVLDNTLGDGFGDALRANKVDMLFYVGWNGSALDPYNLMKAYTTPQYQYDTGYDTTVDMLDISFGEDAGETLQGKRVRMSVYDWTMALQGESPTGIVLGENGESTEDRLAVYAGGDAPVEMRLTVLAALEGRLLTKYNMIPITDDSTAALKGQKVTYYTEDYIYGVARGGVKYMTYKYSDKQWDAWLSYNGGTLNYK